MGLFSKTPDITPEQAFLRAVDLLKNNDAPTQPQLKELDMLLGKFDVNTNFVVAPHGKKFPILYYTLGPSPEKCAAAYLVFKHGGNPNVPVCYATDYNIDPPRECSTPMIMLALNYPQQLKEYLRNGGNPFIGDYQGDGIFHYVSDLTPLESVQQLKDAMGATTQGRLHANSHGVRPIERWLEKARVVVEKAGLAENTGPETFIITFPPRKMLDQREKGPGSHRLIDEPAHHIRQRRMHFWGLIKLLYEENCQLEPTQRHLNQLRVTVSGPLREALESYCEQSPPEKGSSPGR